MDHEQELLEFIEKIALDRKHEIKESSKKLYLNVAGLFQPFEQLTKERIDQQLKNLSPYTHNLYLIVLKYLVKFDYIPETIISHLKRKKTEKKYQSKKQLLTREELQKLIHVAKEPQMKALYSLLYESGARIGELLQIKRSDVYTFKKHDGSIEWNVFLAISKTTSREIPIIECLSYLLPYLNHRGDFEGQLWKTSPTSEKLLYDTLSKRLKADCKEAGIKKISLHTFRHSRATELAAIFPASVLMAFFGWSSYDMVKIYVTLAGSDLRRSVNEFYGLETNEEKIIIEQCPVCQIPITSEMNKCPQCNHSFIKKFKNPNESSREKIIRMLSDPEFSTQMIEIIERYLDKLESERKE